MSRYPTADAARIQETLRLTLVQLSGWGLPPTPIHYAVAYEAVSRINPALDQALVALEHPPTAEDIEVFYQRYIAPEHALGGALSRVNITNEILSTLSEITAATGPASAEIQEIQKSFVTPFARLRQEAGLSAADVSDAIKHLLTETKRLLGVTTVLQEKVSAGTTELERLKIEISTLAADAGTDPLTKILNRAGFSRKMDALIRAGTPYSLMFLDLDHFKKINDGFGHALGDRALVALAEIMRAKTRGEDIVARYGGEEFVIVLPETPKKMAFVVAEHIRRAVESVALTNKHTRQTLQKLSVSIGIAATGDGAPEPYDLIVERADQAMYRAKQEGRNRTCLAD